MTMNEINRKARITYLNLRIAVLRLAMSFEQGVSDEWKSMARRQADFIRQRNNLLTAAEIRKIEKRRGLI